MKAHSKEMERVAEMIEADVLGGLETRWDKTQECLVAAAGVTETAPVGTIWKWTYVLEVTPSADGSTINSADAEDWPEDWSSEVRACMREQFPGIEVDQKLPSMKLEFPFVYVVSKDPAKPE